MKWRVWQISLTKPLKKICSELEISSEKKSNMKTLPLPVSDGCDQYEKAQLLLDDYHSTS